MYVTPTETLIVYVKEFAGQLSDAEYAEVMRTFDMQRNYGDKEKLLQAPASGAGKTGVHKCVAFATAILRSAF